MSLPIILDWIAPKEIEIIDGFRKIYPKSLDKNGKPKTPQRFKEEIKIVPCVLIEADYSYLLEYKLCGVPTLFLTFSNTEQTTEGILSFASDYGLLGTLSSGFYKTEDDAHQRRWLKGMEAVRRGDSEKGVESIERWIKEIKGIRKSIDLWMNLETEAKKHIRWEGYDEVYYDSPTMGPRLITSKTKFPEILESLRPGDHIGPGKIYLMYVINHYIGRSKAQMMIVNNRMQPCYFPNNLLSGMWYQFAEAVAEDKKYRACEYCGIHFELGVGKAPLTKKYCSTKCRVAANRKKHT